MNKSWIYKELVLKIIKFFLNIGSGWVKSNNISVLQDYFRKSLLIDLLLTYRFVYI